MGMLEAIAKKQGLSADADFFASKLNYHQNTQIANDSLEDSEEWRAMKITIESPSAILQVSSIQSFPNSRWKKKPDLMKRGLTHLHSIGEIVLFGKDKICNRPEEVSRLMAKFISPRHVRDNLLFNESDQVNVLSTSSISEILRVDINRFVLIGLVYFSNT